MLQGDCDILQKMACVKWGLLVVTWQDKLETKHVDTESAEQCTTILLLYGETIAEQCSARAALLAQHISNHVMFISFSILHWCVSMLTFAN